MSIIVFQSQETKTKAGQKFTLKREAIALRNFKQIAPTEIPKSAPQIINLHNNSHKPTTLIYAYFVVNNYQIIEFREEHSRTKNKTLVHKNPKSLKKRTLREKERESTRELL
jgi:hypothetical protein